MGLNSVKVRVTNVSVEHELMLKNFTTWLDGAGGSPRDIVQRKRIKEFFGCATRSNLMRDHAVRSPAVPELNKEPARSLLRVVEAWLYSKFMKKNSYEPS
jgi:hypothetical protein